MAQEHVNSNSQKQKPAQASSKQSQGAKTAAIPSITIMGHTFVGSHQTEESVLYAAERILNRRARKTGELMTNPENAQRMMQMRLRGLEREVFAAMFLDVRHRLIAIEDLFMGGVSGIEIHPAVVVRRALVLNASSVIIGHNHPSGDPEPSSADRSVTLRIKQALNLVDIRLVDHFVVGDGSVSLAARGWV